jgi:hypothetical protein
MGVAFNTHDREIEDIGLATSRDDGVAIRGRNDRQPLPDGDLVAKIAPHDEMRHVFELADIDLRGSGAPEGSTATSALILSGAVSAALNPKLPPWLCATTTQRQTFFTSAS